MPASRKLAKTEAAALAKQAAKIIVAKGKKVSEFPGGKADREVVEAMLPFLKGDFGNPSSMHALGERSEEAT